MEHISRSAWSAIRPHVDRAIQETFYVVCMELLENLMRYSDWESSRKPEMTVRCFQGPRVEVVSRNVPAPQARSAEQVVKLVKGVGGPKKARKAARERARVLAFDETVEDDSAGLGFLRIVGEAFASIDAEADERERLTIRAVLDTNSMNLLPRRFVE